MSGLGCTKICSRIFRQHVGMLDDEDALERLLGLLYSGKPFGWFFSVGVKELDKEAMRRELSNRQLDLRTIFESIMVVHARTRGKDGIGAKFPLHYSYADTLLDWFPNARLIHTTRNPKATYASQAAKYIKNEKNPVARAYMRFKQFVHINIQISWTASVHKKLKHLQNYQLVRYEDVIDKPELELRRICEFLNTEFVPEMLSPNQYGSSFGSIGNRRGVDKSSLERWRTSIHPLTSKAIDLLHPRAGRDFGY